MARSIPRIRDDSLHVPTRDGDGISIITLGSAAWDSWVEQARSFRFESPHASFTARKEQRSSGWYWYAYRRRHGTLHIAYLGKSEELSSERLHTVAAVLERAEHSSEKTSHLSRQSPFDASLQNHHSSNVSSPAALSGEYSQPSASPVSQHNLPIQVTSLVGREAAIATATALLRRPEVRLLSLIGTGGIGKTRLAIEVATQLLEDFPDGVFFVALTPLRDPDMVLPTIAHTLGLKESGSEPVTERLHTYLRDKQLLLVLDNFEHLMPAAPLVGELLTSSPNLTLLVTSREGLHLRAEQQFSVPPLAVPDRKHVAQVQSLTEYPALELFLQRARAVKHDFQLHESNAQALADICTRLDGLPLAIELAAARIAMFSPQALLARLDHRLQVLTHGSTDLPERQQTLRQTIQWSHELLKPEEQRLFRRMSVFVGGATLEAIEAVCEAPGDEMAWVFDGVTSLIDKSLLQQMEQEDGEPRFMMLETIREYGLEVLEASEEMLTMREIHARYYSRLAQEAETELIGPQQTRWLERLEREHDNVRVALSWLLEPKAAEEVAARTELALRLVTALHLFWIFHAHMHEGMAFLERVLAASAGAAPALRAKALAIAADLAYTEENHRRQEELAAEGLVLCREVGDKAGTAFCLYTLGGIAWIRCEYVRGCSLLEESVALFRELGNKHRLGWSLTALANTELDQGEYLRARSRYEEALALFRELGDKQGIASILFLLALLRFYVEDALTARLLAEEALGLGKELGTKWGTALLFYLLGEIALSQGDLVTASQLAQEALELHRELGRKVSITNSLSLAARVQTRQGNYAAARRLSEESLILAREVDDKRDLPFYLEGLAEVVAAQGEGVWAARLWGAAAAQRDTSGIPLPPVYRANYVRSVADARAQFGEKAFAAAWAQGRTMPLEQLLAAHEPLSMTAPIPADRVLAPPVPTASTDGLTAREMEVLRLVAQGLSDEQIAHQLVISRHTVNSHLKAIYGKIGVTSRHAATHYVLQHHLL